LRRDFSAFSRNKCIRNRASNHFTLEIAETMPAPADDVQARRAAVLYFIRAWKWRNVGFDPIFQGLAFPMTAPPPSGLSIENGGIAALVGRRFRATLAPTVR
jgi:hypothetical protein